MRNADQMSSRLIRRGRTPATPKSSPTGSNVAVGFPFLRIRTRMLRQSKSSPPTQNSKSWKRVQLITLRLGHPQLLGKFSENHSGVYVPQVLILPRKRLLPRSVYTVKLLYNGPFK